MQSTLIPLALTLALTIATPITAHAQAWDCNAPVAGPDVVLGTLDGIMEWGTVGAISGYSIGATACNVGDADMPWVGTTFHHPVIAQNLYRLENGRFEQIGMSWVKHGFGSSTGNVCCAVCNDPNDNQIIGPGCSDTYSPSLNGRQGLTTYSGNLVGGMGPRSDVNPTTGLFPYPYSTMGATGNEIYKRIQVRNADVNAAAHPTAQYFGEVHYITPDEPVVHRNNNASYRRAILNGTTGGTPVIDFTGSTTPGLPAIAAWKAADPDVTLVTIDDPAGGRFWLGSRATEREDGTFDYEYALYNMNSNLAARRFMVALEPGAFVTSVGFHDVDPHSGETHDGIDWALTVNPTEVEWSTADLPSSNALRWGTLYNFRLVSNYPPVMDVVEIGMHGSSDTLTPDAVRPGRPCGAMPYCSTAPNSAGAGSTLLMAGSTSLSLNNLLVVAVDGVPGAFGLFYYGANPTQTAFGDGFRCVDGQVFRLGPPVSAGVVGQSSVSLDYTLPPMNAGTGQIQAGDTWHFQNWYRDTNGPLGTGFNLSNGLAVTFCP